MNETTFGPFGGADCRVVLGDLLFCSEYCQTRLFSISQGPLVISGVPRTPTRFSGTHTLPYSRSTQYDVLWPEALVFRPLGGGEELFLRSIESGFEFPQSETGENRRRR